MIGKNTGLRPVLLAAAAVQFIICLTAIGVYHPDQYFQIIEFSSWQLNKVSAVGHVWEFSAHLRSTLQVYLFSAWTGVCSSLFIRDPYLQLTLLRVAFGMTLFAFFNWMTWYYLQHQSRRILIYSLLILNFSWILPYTRTLFSSEMLSSLLLFGAIFLYDVAGGQGSKRWWVPLLTGFLFSLAFYSRFQTAFGLAGFLAWILFVERKWRRLLPMAGGFIAGVVLNTGLDFWFYHQWVFTPYVYFDINILQGKAASMGTSSFLLYIGALVAVVLAPPLSIVLLYTGFKAAFLKKYANPLVATVVCFIVGHCFVAHKEERFLFPVLNVLPIFIGWGMSDLIGWYRHRKKPARLLYKALAGVSITLNALLLIILLFTPYSQAIYFTWLLRKDFDHTPVTIYSLKRTPFETEHGLPYIFYQQGAANLQWKELETEDSLRYVRDKPVYISATYNDVKDRPGLMDSLGYQRVLYSSRLLWQINEFIDSRKLNTINDIWVLYKRKSD
jgi:GPI mannosyltransferase 3